MKTKIPSAKETFSSKWVSEKALYEVLLVVGLLVFSRLIPHWPNVTALGAVAILAPRWLHQNPLTLIIPLLALLVSDFILGFHSTMIFTYFAIFLVSFFSWKTHHESTIRSQVSSSSSLRLHLKFPLKMNSGSQFKSIFQSVFQSKFYSRLYSIFYSIATWGLISCLLFFLITNLGAWALLDMYPKTWNGLVLSYFNALPFLLNDLLGTFAYLSVAIALREVCIHFSSTRSLSRASH